MSGGVDLRCPLCGRPVRRGALSCVCGNILTGSGAPISLGGGSGDPEAGRVRRDYGAFLPWVPVAGAVVMLLWMLEVLPLGYTGGRVVKLVVVTVLGSALLAMLAAEWVRVSEPEWELADERLSDLTPAMWFGAVALFWPVGLPVFLYQYYWKTRQGRVKVGWVGVILFVLGALILWPWKSAPPPPPELPAMGTGGRAVAPEGGSPQPPVAPLGSPRAGATGGQLAPATKTPQAQESPEPVKMDDGSPRLPERVVMTPLPPLAQ